MPVVKTLKQHTLLLDTHILLWHLEGNSILLPSFRKILEKKEHGTVLISAISIWEIGMLVEKGRITLEMDSLEWIERALECPLFQLVPLSPQIAIQSTRLPGIAHGDPADRILIATAHIHNAVLVSRDEKILAFGQDRFCSVYNPTSGS